MEIKKMNIKIKADCKPLLNDLRQINKEIQKLINPTRYCFSWLEFWIGLIVGELVALIIFLINKI